MKSNIFILVFTACVVHSLAICRQKPGGIAESWLCENIMSLGALENVPENTLEITILDSKIQTLPANSFVKFKSLRHLEITRCQLSNIQNGAFAGLRGLEELIIVENKIKTVQENWIKDIPTLRVLNVWKNEIDTIEPGIFKHLGRLETFDIAHNNLKHCLTIEQLEKLEELDTLYITGNDWPLRCRPALVFYLSNRHINLVHNWGTKHLIIADCIAHAPGAKDNDDILKKCYDLIVRNRDVTPNPITAL